MHVLISLTLAFAAAGDVVEPSERESLKHCGRDSIYVAMRSMEAPCTLDGIAERLPENGFADAGQLLDAMAALDVDAELRSVSPDGLAALESYLARRPGMRAAIVALPTSLLNETGESPYHFATVESAAADGVRIYGRINREPLFVPRWRLAEVGDFPAILCERRASWAERAGIDLAWALSSPVVVALGWTAALALFFGDRFFGALGWIRRSVASRKVVYWLGGVAACGLVATGIYVWANAEATTRSAAVFDKLVDAGNLRLSESAVARLVVKNRSDVPIRVEKHSITCRCLGVTPDEAVVPPYDERAFRATIQSTTFGRQSQDVVFRWGAADAPLGDDDALTSVRIEYVGIASDSIQPRNLYIGSFPSLATAMRTAVFRADPELVASVKSVDLVDGETMKEMFHVIDVRKDLVEGVIEVDLTCDGKSDVGDFAFPLGFDCGDEKTFICKISGEICYPFSVESRESRLGSDGELSVVLQVHHAATDLPPDVRLLVDGASVEPRSVRREDDRWVLEAALPSGSVAPRSVAVISADGVELSLTATLPSSSDMPSEDGA